MTKSVALLYIFWCLIFIGLGIKAYKHVVDFGHKIEKMQETKDENP